MTLNQKGLEAAKKAFDEVMGMDEDYPAPWEEYAPAEYKNFAVEPVIEAYLRTCEEEDLRYREQVKKCHTEEQFTYLVENGYT